MIRKIFVSLPLYVRESFRKAAEISNHTGMSRCATALDLISSKIRHGASFEDYVALEFFRKNNRERARYVTTDKNVKDLYLRISDMNAATTINEKDKFAQKFRDFLGRDCICVDKSNLKDAFSFVDRYGKAIAKPFDGYEGNGIFMINSEKKDTLERLQNLVIGGGQVYGRRADCAASCHGGS